jgi:hypothetical protein
MTSILIEMKPHPYPDQTNEFLTTSTLGIPPPAIYIPDRIPAASRAVATHEFGIVATAVSHQHSKKLGMNRNKDGAGTQTGRAVQGSTGLKGLKRRSSVGSQDVMEARKGNSSFQVPHQSGTMRPSVEKGSPQQRRGSGNHIFGPSVDAVPNVTAQFVRHRSKSAYPSDFPPRNAAQKNVNNNPTSSSQKTQSVSNATGTQDDHNQARSSLSLVDMLLHQDSTSDSKEKNRFKSEKDSPKTEQRNSGKAGKRGGFSSSIEVISH